MWPFKKSPPIDALNEDDGMWSVMQASAADGSMLVRINATAKRWAKHPSLGVRVGFAISLNHPNSHEDAASAENFALNLIDQINDIEIIWLRFYSYPYISWDEESRNKHVEILEPIGATLDSDEQTVDRQALHGNYTEHLISLSLLTRPLQIDSKTGYPVFDKYTKNWKTQGTQTTPLGRLLVKYIGLGAQLL